MGCGTSHFRHVPREASFVPGYRQFAAPESQMSAIIDGHVIMTHVSQYFIKGDLTLDKLNKGVAWARKRYSILQSKCHLVPISIPIPGGGYSGIVDSICIPTVEESMAREIEVKEEQTDSADAFRSMADTIMSDFLTYGVLDLENGPLWKLHLLRNGNSESALTVLSWHAIDDQGCVNALVQGILNAAEDIDQPDDPLPLAAPLLHNAEAGLCAKIGLARRIGKSLEGATTLPPQYSSNSIPICPSIADRSSTVYSLDLTVKDTAAIVARAKAEGTTVHGLLLAASSITAAAILGGAKNANSNEKTTVSIATAVDMRRRIPECTVTLEDMVYYQGGAVQAVEIEHGNENDNNNEKLISLAKDLGEELSTFLGSEHTLATLVGMGSLASPTAFAKSVFSNATKVTKPSNLGRAVSVTLTNIGVDPFPSVIGGLERTSLRWGSPVVLSGASFLLSIVTIGGRMCLSSINCEEIMGKGVTKEFVDGVEAKLLAILS